MVAIPRTHQVKLPVATIGAVATASVVAIVMAALPSSLLDPLVEASGLPALVAVAAPPLGATGRTLLALASGVVVGAVVWSVIVLTLGTHIMLGQRQPGDAPTLRRADAHPDAPARAPIRAAEELGPPLPPPEPVPQIVARTVPRNLDIPLSAFDPHAIPDIPRAPVRAVEPMVKPPVLAVDRLETFELTPLRRDLPSPPRTEDLSIAALLDRLERSAGRPVRPGRSLDETIGALRRLAAG